MKSSETPITDVTCFVLGFAIVAIPFAGWITNILWTFRQTELVPVLLGILGTLAAPIGAIHGIALWF